MPSPTLPETVPALAALFEKLGARDPRGWAESQLTEGIPQLHRFLFLREAWRLIVDEGDTGWIDRQMEHAQKHPGAPYSGIGAALRRALAAGASREDLAAIARGMQAEFLFGLCYLLDDNGLSEPELAGVGWGLFQTDEDGNPLEPVYALHESVLDTDPTGREMRPSDPA